MLPNPHHLFILLSFLSLLTLISAASPTSFCKCTCFTNSTIIPLDAPRSPSPLLLRTRQDTLLASRDDDNGEKDGDQDGNGEKGREGNDDDNDNGKGDGDGRKEFRPGNCNDCNRQYCIDAHLPICKGAGVEDVLTTCFQRDSRKDEAVVFIFIFATAGLLGWAALKPWVGTWIERARERSSYIPVANQGDT